MEFDSLCSMGCRPDRVAPLRERRKLATVMNSVQELMLLHSMSCTRDSVLRVRIARKVRLRSYLGASDSSCPVLYMTTAI